MSKVSEFSLADALYLYTQDMSRAELSAFRAVLVQTMPTYIREAARAAKKNGDAKMKREEVLAKYQAAVAQIAKLKPVAIPPEERAARARDMILAGAPVYARRLIKWSGKSYDIGEEIPVDLASESDLDKAVRSVKHGMMSVISDMSAHERERQRRKRFNNVVAPVRSEFNVIATKNDETRHELEQARIHVASLELKLKDGEQAEEQKLAELSELLDGEDISALLD